MAVPLTRSLLALSTMAVHHRDTGLNCRLGADVAMTYGVELYVPGGEAGHALAEDRADALAIKADAPHRREGVREGDAHVGRWLHHGGLDSVILEEHGPPKVGSSKW